MKSILSIIVLLIVVSSPESLAQKRKAERAYEFFNAGEYFQAIDHFKDTYSKSKDKAVKHGLYGSGMLPVD
jgi:ABC-type molybdate transport system substrate-binding protein